MEEKKHIINFDEMPMEQGEPRWTEEIRCDENGEVEAYVLKRNPNYRKK